MVYIGSKNRIAKHIKPFIENALKDKELYVEPFVGGANMIDKIDFPNKVGFDINANLIELLNNTDKIGEFKYITKEEYYIQRERWKNGEVDYWIGYCGFIFSYRARYFGGFGLRDNAISPSGKDLNREKIARHNNLLKQASDPLFKQCSFKVGDYRDLKDIKNAVIYLDPPYKGTNSYTGTSHSKYNPKDLLAMCEIWSKNNNVIFLSEKENLDEAHFKEVFSIDLNHYVLDCKKVKEKLFIYV